MFETHIFVLLSISTAVVKILSVLFDKVGPGYNDKLPTFKKTRQI